jgi:hypothetical protein
MMKTSMKRRIAVVTAILVGIAVLTYSKWLTGMNHVTFASDADCRAAQAVVKEGDALTDAAAEKSWAVGARVQKDKIEHERLRAGVTKYITLVDRTFSGPKPESGEKGHAFSDMWDACRQIEVNYPTPALTPDSSALQR